MRVPKTYVRRLLTGTAVMLLVIAGAPAALTQSEAPPTAAVTTANKAVTYTEADGVAALGLPTMQIEICATAIVP